MFLRGRRRASSLTALSCLLLALLVLFSGHVCEVSSFGVGGGKSKIVVSVCQNKDCCKRFDLNHANLVQTLEHFLPTTSSDIVIEATGCQSKCDLGPNLAVGEETFNGIRDAQAAAAALEMAVEGLKVPPTLLAAVTVMEKAHGAGSTAEKEKFLNSVIKVLDGAPDTIDSVANAHAHAMRAEIRLTTAPSDAVKDARRATELCPLHPTAWRTLADAQESAGDVKGALDSLSKWAEVNPQFATKISKEKARLASMV